MSPHKIECLAPESMSLSSFDLTDNGFLPAETPVQQLASKYYAPWEDLMARLPELLRTFELRSHIDRLPLLSTMFLTDEREARRAYSIMAFLSQGYIWQGPLPSERLPPAIAVPFLELSERLEVPPVATYASLNLWNWAPVKEGLDIHDPANQQAISTFTGTDDESWFYVISSAIETRAASLLRRMLASLNETDHEDVPEMTESLKDCKDTLHVLGGILKRMDERCDPHVFYGKIRPYLAGSVNMEAAGLPQGIFFDNGDGSGSWHKYRGGSNGQSSLLHFLDVALGVDHSRSGQFHQEMRDYMPGPHARFLSHVESMSSFRDFVRKHDQHRSLVGAYNEAVAALKAFRDLHIQLVTKYIVIPSRRATSQQATKLDLASATSNAASESNDSTGFVGTGGTKFMSFLRGSRDETSAATILPA